MTDSAAEGLPESELDVDAILLGNFTPGLDGFEMAHFHHLDRRQRAAQQGAGALSGGIPPVTELRVHSSSLLRIKEATEEMRRHSLRLEGVVKQRTGELMRAREEMAAARHAAHAAHLDTIRRLVAAA